MILRRERTVSFGPAEGLRRFGRAEQDGTAVVLAATWSREESERHPGRFLTLHHDHMGLDNYPIRCTCGKHSYSHGIPKGYTHREEEPCPFEQDRFPIGMMGACCWLRGKAAARELEALREGALADRMFQDMTAEEALAFAEQLVDAALRLEGRHAGQPDKPKGAGWNGTWDAERKEWVWETYSTFEEALSQIREAARWYEKVGRLGFGVHAWY